MNENLIRLYPKVSKNMLTVLNKYKVNKNRLDELYKKQLIKIEKNKDYLNIFIDDSIQSDRLGYLLYYTLKFKTYNKLKFNIVKDFKDSQVIIFLVNSRENLINIKSNDKYKYLFETKIPIIILERQDSAITWCREIDQLKNLKAIFKNRILRNKDLQNTDDTIHGKNQFYLVKELLNNNDLRYDKSDIGSSIYINDTKLPNIDSEFLDKIEAILWDFHSSPLNSPIHDGKQEFDLIFNKLENKNGIIPMKYYRYKDINFNKEYDIFCINQLKKNNFVDVPRKIAKNIVNSLSNKYKVLTNNEQSIEFSNYRKLFEKSKICIGCWGFGEWVHMDAYAMYAGVILIKPNTDHVLMYPDIYKSGETYIACKHDYSDLKSIIINILENYHKYKEMLIRNRNKLMEIDEKHCVERFWEKVISYA